jgi:large subunit ribosomal protein L18
MQTAKQLHARRTRRSRFRVALHAKGKPRLSVFRSSKQIYAQVIDDRQGRTLVAASSIDKDLKGKLGNGADMDAAVAVGFSG